MTTTIFIAPEDVGNSDIIELISNCGPQHIMLDADIMDFKKLKK